VLWGWALGPGAALSAIAAQDFPLGAPRIVLESGARGKFLPVGSPQALSRCMVAVSVSVAPRD